MVRHAEVFVVAAGGVGELQGKAPRGRGDVTGWWERAAGEAGQENIQGRRREARREGKRQCGRPVCWMLERRLAFEEGNKRPRRREIGQDVLVVGGFRTT